MDDVEPTKATPADPTAKAPAEDETTLMETSAVETPELAWSASDEPDTDVVEYRPWSWKSPVLLIAAVIALLGVGVVVYKINDIVDGGATNPVASAPQVAAPVHPTIAESPPVQVIDPDQRFIALLKQRGHVAVSPPLAVNAAHWVCSPTSQTRPAPELVQALIASTPGMDDPTAAVFVATAQEVYCPPTP